MRLRILLPLAALLALNWALLYPERNRDAFDAITTYLPMARHVLSDGLGYFATEPSIHMPPFAYIWPALLGANLEAVKMANLALTGATLLMVFRTGWLLHSEVAGLAAAALFALCPTTKPFLATALSEPPYFLLTAAWLWSLAEYYASGRRAFLAVAAVALGLATLTRGSLFYLLPLLVAFFAWRRQREAAAAHAVALAFPLAFLVKNLELFGFPFFATGSGNALYLGAHPVTGGYDPYYFGIEFDTGSVTQGPTPLTLASERLFSGIARMMIFEGDPLHLAALYARKLAAFLFVSDLVIEGNVMVLRAWRIATLVLAVVGLRALGNSLLRWVVGLTLAYQVVVHIPVLYTFRYSVDALDLWLALLAGLGLAALFERRDGRAAARVALVIAVGLGAGWWQYRYGEEPQLDLSRTRSPLVWEAQRVQGIGVIELRVPPSPRFHPWNNYALALDAAAGCSTIRISFRPDAGTAFGRAVTHRLSDDGRVHRYRFGATTPLGMNQPGRLRLEVPCMLQISRIALHTIEAGIELRERYTARQAAR